MTSSREAEPNRKVRDFHHGLLPGTPPMARRR